MKQSKTFIGVLLIGFGLFFVLQQYSIPILSRFDTWPTILIILGMAFLAQGYLNKQPESILPGGILTGLGIHFHALHHWHNVYVDWWFFILTPRTQNKSRGYDWPYIGNHFTNRHFFHHATEMVWLG